MKLNNCIYKDNDPEMDDTSEYMESGEMTADINFNTLPSDRFTNIRKIYESPSNPTEIHSAIRYGKRYMLKGLKEDFRQDPIQLMALSKEFEIGISLDHPNIRRTIGFEEVQGLGKVIVLEYFDGQPLNEFLSSGVITSYQSRTIADQIVSALRYIHRRQIIHKDLKLSNILISHHGLYVSLIDFNLSDSDSFIILKNPAGTRKYMAPELSKPGTAPSILTDIYSFGVIINELAAAANDVSLMKIADKCMAIDPSVRPRSVEEIVLPRTGTSQPTVISRFLSSKVTTYLFLLLSTIIAIIICRLLFIRFGGI